MSTNPVAAVGGAVHSSVTELEPLVLATGSRIPVSCTSWCSEHWDWVAVSEGFRREHAGVESIVLGREAHFVAYLSQNEVVLTGNDGNGESLEIASMCPQIALQVEDVTKRPMTNTSIRLDIEHAAALAKVLTELVEQCRPMVESWHERQQNA